jgi:hypothetical protein
MVRQPAWIPVLVALFLLSGCAFTVPAPTGRVRDPMWAVGGELR